MPAKIKAALAPFQVESCSAGKRTPIQERQVDFPEHQNVSVTIFDLITSYPATNHQVRDTVAARAGIPLANVRVYSLAEQEEHAINHMYDNKSGQSVLNTPELEFVPGGQDLVGEKHNMRFLQELNKEKHGGAEYTGVNDEILAKGAPKHDKQTPGKQPEIKTKFVNILGKVKNPDNIMKGAK